LDSSSVILPNLFDLVATLAVQEWYFADDRGLRSNPSCLRSNEAVNDFTPDINRSTVNHVFILYLILIMGYVTIYVYSGDPKSYHTKLH
jgi:hypothetical protein